MAEKFMKSLIRKCVRLVTPVDSSIGEDNPGKLSINDRSFSDRFVGMCKFVFWYAAAVCAGLLISRLH